MTYAELKACSTKPVVSNPFRLDSGTIVNVKAKALPDAETVESCDEMLGKMTTVPYAMSIEKIVPLDQLSAETQKKHANELQLHKLPDGTEVYGLKIVRRVKANMPGSKAAIELSKQSSID
jgi:uncharacterized protein YycO